MTPRINKSEACFVCARRASPFAVGPPKRVGWYCEQCGPETVKRAMKMTHMDFDAIERGACSRVAALIESGTDDVTIVRAELPLFVAWVVEEFAKQMRAYVNDEEIPF